MKVESITISLGRTLNTGNFESYRVEVVDAELKSRVKAAKEKLERIRGTK